MHNETLRARALPDDASYALRLAAGFGALVGVTWGLIVLGALVRAHDAGLACPDWPLCFGQFVPQMNLQVAFEYTHRVAAGSVSIAFVTLAALALWRPATREACSGLLALAAGLLALQVLLGALTVWQLLASWTVTSHLLTGNAFAVALFWIALSLRDAARGEPPAPRPAAAVRRWVGLAALLLVGQMVLGGLVASRYAGLACAEWPACRDGLWFPAWSGPVGLHLLHRLNGYALLLALGVAALCAARAGAALRATTFALLGLALAQVAVGVANVLLKLPVEMTGLHSALAAALVLLASLAVRQSWLGEAKP